MLYQTLRLVAGVALRWYYSEVSAVGLERVPRTAPLLVVVNHPNALVDALVVGWVLPRRVRITAKAVLFDNPVLAAFLRTVGAVPLRRVSDELKRRRPEAAAGHVAAPDSDPIDPARNAEAFRAILDSLEEGSAVLIFPEGISHDAPTLAPLKSGAARMALAARDAHRAPGLQVLPVGLVFESKDVLRSRALAVVGEPIDVHTWHPPSGAIRPADALTAEIDRRLRDVMLSAPTTGDLVDLQVLAQHVAEILAPAPRAVGAGRPLHDEYVIAARLARGLRAMGTLPAPVQQAAEDAQARTARFIESLRSLGITPADIAISLRKRHGAWFAVRESALLALVGPVAVWGRMNHWIPFRLARRIALRDVTSRDQPAMRTIVAGLGLVLGSYGLLTAFVAWLVSPWVALAYLVTLPLAADVDLRYAGRVRAARRRMGAYVRLRGNPALAAALRLERAALANDIRRLDTFLHDQEQAHAEVSGAAGKGPRGPSARPRPAGPSAGP